MKIRLLALALLVSAPFAGAAENTLSAAEKADGWQLLFDGTSWNGWRAYRKKAGEPIVGWWSDLVEIPRVAFDPTEPADLDILLPQNPDFIRPSDAMWESAEEAHRIITAIMERISRS